MIFEYLESWNLIISRKKRAFEVRKKKHVFPCFLGALLDTQNKLGKM